MVPNGTDEVTRTVIPEKNNPHGRCPQQGQLEDPSCWVSGTRTKNRQRKAAQKADGRKEFGNPDYFTGAADRAKKLLEATEGLRNPSEQLTEQQERTRLTPKKQEKRHFDPDGGARKAGGNVNSFHFDRTVSQEGEHLQAELQLPQVAKV